MKKIFNFIISSVALLIMGCMKDTPSVDFSHLGAVVEILPPQAGLENFGNAALSYPFTDSSDDALVVVNIASPKPLNKTLQVTLGIIDSARVAYNGLNSASYEALPDSAFSFPVNTGSIAAGNRLDTFTVTFYPSKIDTTKSYMLPVGITDAQGQTISGNFGIVYFHFDGR